MVTVDDADAPYLDAFFQRAFERSRRRYIEGWLAVSGGGIVLVAWPAQFLTLHPLWGPAEGDLRAFLLAMVCGVSATAALMLWAAGRPFRPIVRYLRGEPVDPAAVWHAAVRRSPRVSLVCTTTYCTIGNIPLVLLVGPPRDFTFLDYLSGWLVACLITASAGFFFVLIWEVAFRPVLLEIQPLLPLDFDPDKSWLTLSRRSALASASAMVYTAAAVASLVAVTDDRELALAIAVLATIGSAATFGGGITGLVSHSIFTRVSDLKMALTRLGDRDYDVRVAVRAGDELDDAAASLNRMAERLKADDAALRASRARLASIADGERQRMERDLRRRVLVRLERIGEELGSVATEVVQQPDLRRLCTLARGSVADAEEEIQRLARGVYPAELTEAGLEPALAAAAERTAVPTVLHSSGVGRLDGTLESAVYFCCNEALQNAAKHAGPGATSSVTLRSDDGRLAFEVTDDGRGFADDADGRGLENMRDRIRAAGGDLTISSRAGVGTSVSGWVPAQVGQSAG